MSSQQRNHVGSIESADLVVVGSGLFGLTIAERAANELGMQVAIIEKRTHVGGNAYSEFDVETGIEVHKYGSHIFHTSNEKVWSYVNQFTSFTNYEHRVYALANGKYYNLPINLQTLSEFCGEALTPKSAHEYITAVADTRVDDSNLEGKSISLVGKEIYETLIKGYTEKQWQVPPKELPASTITRLPVRFNFNSRYFDDKYQGLPTKGYQQWFNNLLASEKITVHTGIDYFDIRDDLSHSQPLFYTGSIDRFFNYKHGKLKWRTLDLEFEKLNTHDFQGTSVLNYSDLATPFTRIHEFHHLHPERTRVNPNKSIIAREFSRVAEPKDEPYYPVNSLSDRESLGLYREEVRKSRIHFGGRLGTYQYLDMHMAIASALTVFNEFTRKL